jgi:hypothetical protein
LTGKDVGVAEGRSMLPCAEEAASTKNIKNTRTNFIEASY